MTWLNVRLVGVWKLHVICRGWRFWYWRVLISKNTFITPEWVVANVMSMLENRRDEA